MANNLVTTDVRDVEDAVETADPLDIAQQQLDHTPVGFKTAEDFLRHAREEFDADAAYDRENREAALEDLKFVAGDQWDDLVKADRVGKGRPCLTINVLPQFIGQVIGDRRINKTTIKVRPKKDATIEQADVRSGLIKSIEAFSRAERVYDAACEDQVTCGISNFRIDLDYADNDVFEQDIFIRHIPNPLAVVWDRMSVDPTGRDAGHCFVQDIMPRKVYEKRWPEHPCPGELGDSLGNTLSGQGWFDKDVVRITEYWRLIDKPRTIALMLDGDVKDVTDLDPEQYEHELWIDASTGKPKIRKGMRTYAQMHLITGFAILTPAYEIPVTRLPIIKVEGRVVRVGDDRVRYGLVRYAKDSQRLKNYWRSVAAETLAMAPKSQWIAPDDAVDGREEDFRNAHISGDPLLIYNKNSSAPPQRMDPPTVPAALLQEAQMNQQDIKDTTGLHDASLGIRSNEISGKAINARKMEGDVATVMYHDNLNASIQEGGDVINQLIPIAYDSVRTIRVIGADDKNKLMKVNDRNDENSPDITSGKYDVAIETGPSYTTQRQEAADAMMQAIQVAPQLMEIAGDLIVKAQDWPGAQEISERLKKTIPQNMLSEDDPEKAQPTPEQMEQEALAQEAQKVQMMEAIEVLKHNAQLRAIELAQRSAEVELIAAQVAETLAKTEKITYEAEVAKDEADFGPFERVHKMNAVERGASADNRSPINRPTGPRPAGDRDKRPNPKGSSK